MNFNGKTMTAYGSFDTTDTTVKYIKQDLTDEQKAQARENVGAVSETEVDEIKTEVKGYVNNSTANAIKKTVTGEVVQITDASPNPHNMKVKFEGGKQNLFNLDSVSAISKEQVSKEGNTIRIKAGSELYGIKMDGTMLEVGKTYTFSLASAFKCMGWRLGYADGSDSSFDSLSGNIRTMTIEKAVNLIYFYVGSPCNATEDILLSYIQITEGSQMSCYRACKSKNLIPFPYDIKSGDSTNGITVTIQDDGGIVLNGTNTNDAWFRLSRVLIDNEMDIAACVKYNAENYSNSRKFVANSSDGNPGTTNEITKWRAAQSGAIYLCVRPGTHINEIAYPQIEVGQTSTSYEKGEPYSCLSLDENGCCEIPSDSERLTIWANDGGPVEVEYQSDLNAELSRLSPNARLEEYGLPILYLEGDTYAMSKDIESALAYRYGDRQGTCTMKWQGSSSLSHPKKNYTIKFDDKFEAKEGWGEQKKYCLKANYVDASHARNIVCARIWADFVKSRTTPNEKLLSLPNCGAVDGFPVMLVINGEFHGLYTFNIPKDKWAYGMGEGEYEAAICAEGVQNPNGHDGAEVTRFKKLAELDGYDFEVEYCPDEDNTDWIKTSLNRLIGAVKDSDGSDIDTTIAQYVDLDSAIDKYIFDVFTKGFDNVSRNYVLTTYDGVKWIFNGYDMDSTFGLAPGSNNYKPNEVWHCSFGQNAALHKLFDLLKTYKKDAVKARYLQLRSWGESDEEPGALCSDTPMLRASEFISMIPQGVYSKDFDKWRGVTFTSTNNYAQIAEFMYKRLKYMDEAINEL